MKRTAWLFVLSVSLSLVSTVIVTVLQRFAQHRRRVSQEVEKLFSRRATRPTRLILDADLAELPEPVQRWLRASGVVGMRMPSAVRLKQRGGIRSSRSASYMPFVACQYYTVDPPGFVWSAKVQPFPGVILTGLDTYVEGAGKMEIRLMATLPIVNASGPEMNQGTMLRYLNEIMWFPAAALSPAISWQAIDSTHALATLTHRGSSVSATFTISAEGRLTTMDADRYREVNGSYLMTPWSTPLQTYREFNGVQVPMEGEGMWKLEDGPFSYIRLQLIDLEYDVAAEYP